MKKYDILIVIALYFSLVTSAQTLYTTQRDSIPAKGDTFKLIASPCRGIIQWQESTDGKEWIDIEGQTANQLTIPTTKEAFYRAKLIDDCFVTYSDSAVVLMTKTVNPTINPRTIDGATLVKSDSIRFVYFYNSDFPLKNGDLLLSSDSSSSIRIVSDIKLTKDSVIVNTINGNLSNIFINKSIKLNTAAKTTAQSITGTKNNWQSRNKTHADDFIHPSKILDKNFNQVKIRKYDTESGNGPMINFEHNFSGKKIYDENGFLVQISEGYYKFNGELKFELDYDQPKFDFKNLKINNGNLKRFSFYTDPDYTYVDSKIILSAQAAGQLSIKKKITIAENVFNKTFMFLVGEVPVWVEVKMDLMAMTSFNVNATFEVSGGISASANPKFGATYENGEWKSIKEAIYTSTMHGPNVNGKADEQLQFEIYPHISIRFYEMIGPYLDIAPYYRQDMNISISGNSDFGLYKGSNLRLGVSMDCFDENIFDYNYEFKFKEDTLYRTPHRLLLASGNNQVGEEGKPLNEKIILQVLDSKNNPVPYYPVNFNYLTENGEPSILNTDVNGKVYFNWILSDKSGEHVLAAFLKDGHDNKMINTETLINASTQNVIKTPLVATNPVIILTETTASCGGAIIEDGGAEIVDCGICWNTTGNPTISDSKTVDESVDSVFTSEMTGLTAGTIYYVRAYATNSKGTAYGNQMNFKIGNEQLISIFPAYNYNNSFTIFTQGIITTGGYTPMIYLGEAFNYGSTAKSKLYTATSYQFIVTDNYSRGTQSSFILSPIGPVYSLHDLLGNGPGTGTSLTLTYIPKTNKIYPITLRAVFQNGEIYDFNFLLIFGPPPPIYRQTYVNFNQKR
ncbi:MAG: hypothetical protein RBT57_01010 [Paludibacter sp.]|jgi:hypothetical protein|nr:hypothetical protein [Paludibacter sp.]